MLVGYARVSTVDQDLGIQLEALEQAHCQKVFSEKVSGSSREQRIALENCLDFIREGDTLVVTRVDRLARSVYDLQNIIKQMQNKGVQLKATEQPIDTSTAAGKAFFDMLGVFAEFETNIRKERQREGVAKAKVQGKYKKARLGKGKAQKDKILALIDKGMTRKAVAKELGIGVATVYRILKAAKSAKV